MQPRHEYTQGGLGNSLRILQSIIYYTFIIPIQRSTSLFSTEFITKKYRNLSVIEKSNQLQPPDLLTARKNAGIHWSGRRGSIPGRTGNLTPFNKPTTNQLSDLTNLSESINHYKRYKLHMPVSNTVHRKGFSLLK